MSINTEREFLNAVLALPNLPTDLKEHAEGAIGKLDARNEKRKNTQTKTQKENTETMKSIVDLITTNGSMVASEIATALGVTTQKASALCGLLVKGGTLTVSDMKVKGKGTVKQYALATEDSAPPADDSATEE